MKILLICPLFDKNLVGGAEYHNYMLATGLSAQASVTVATTTSRKFVSDGAFALRWEDDLPTGTEFLDDLEIKRFSARTRWHPFMGKMISWLILRRWSAEINISGLVLKGSQYYVDYCIRRATSRPMFYDRLFLSGLGPHSLSMNAYLGTCSKEYDVIIASWLPFALPLQVTQIAQRHDIPVILLPLFHPDDIYHHHQSFYRLFGSVTAILAQTSYSANFFSQLNKNARSYIVGPGVDYRAFSQECLSGRRFREKYNLVDKYILLYVGRKEHHKRYDWAVQALNQLADDKIRLVMIGADIDGLPIESPYVTYLNKLPREDLLDAYDACDVLVHPSEHESFGMVFLEAWMRRKPVIGNARCGPVRAVIDHNNNGFLAWNSTDIVNYVRLLVTNPGLATALGEAGYRKTSTNHTWDAVVKKVAQICQQVARSK